LFSTFLAVLAILLISVGQVLLKKLASHGLDPVLLISRQWPLVLGVMATSGGGFLIWLLVLQRMDLVRAFAFAALSFVAVPLLSVWILHERVSPGMMVGQAIIICGILWTALAR
jgi:undecaprenyl phosphate-alpha-L-ara4N flippase subunit ArnE